MLKHMENMFDCVREYILKEGYKKVAAVRSNPKMKDISTEFDLGAENVAIEYCRSHKLPVKILTEEQGEVDLASGTPEFILIFDPVDGSTNLKRGIEGSAFSVACLPYSDVVRPEDVEYALIGSIVSGSVVKCRKGQGVIYRGPFSGKRELSVTTSQNTDLSKAVVGVDLDFGLDESEGFTKEKPHFMRVIPLIKTGIKNLRRSGSGVLGLSYVSTGALDAYIDVRDISTPENWMAAFLLVREAGGVFTDPFGNNIGQVDMLRAYSYIASGNEDIHRRILEKLDMEA